MKIERCAVNTHLILSVRSCNHSSCCLEENGMRLEQEREEMSRNISRLAKPDATQKIAEEAIKLLNIDLKKDKSEIKIEQY